MMNATVFTIILNPTPASFELWRFASDRRRRRNSSTLFYKDSKQIMEVEPSERTCQSLHVAAPGVPGLVLQQQLVVQREAVGGARAPAALLAATR